ncbi:hypothetical protein [Pseudoroseomonas ludipueritiae]|uniref:Uncharacterized protein n=1 Tax=Pseudoroseomonas ludipueritiae TaxID=198093 RepID=A0ABR7R8W0_9PROT|nr:hypothetical protein [Pseudoroseomonas ludipueritiae]MBC9177840.1 hypothetical protein [Pseudoroseomonas ludipueritiae]MCG7363182.1 hypothetical protein [Roseomonas sp. ACRSG]
MLQQVAARLRERSTWAGIALLLSLFGIKIAPDAWSSIVDVGVAAGGAAAILFPERQQ